jgi:hypothetical protein
MPTLIIIRTIITCSVKTSQLKRIKLNIKIEWLKDQEFLLVIVLHKIYEETTNLQILTLIHSFHLEYSKEKGRGRESRIIILGIRTVAVQVDMRIKI